MKTIKIFKDSNENLYVETGKAEGFMVRISDGTNHDGTTIGNFHLVKEVKLYNTEVIQNEKEQDRLEEAFSAVCNLFFATEKDNFSRCGSFHIKPFNTHWDKKTVKEVMYHVKLYLGSWVIHPMEEALKKDRNKIKSYEQKRHREAQKRKKEWEASLKRKAK